MPIKNLTEKQEYIFKLNTYAFCLKKIILAKKQIERAEKIIKFYEDKSKELKKELDKIPEEVKKDITIFDY